ncbi:NERD domain-containing protein [Bacillus sp. FJAT-29790]|uniref:nuclease-related domain-containing protein n=1 Tax=Bacillus sp. FJAT-29790 TaxID=1895002 RepID=UPI001C23408A|nr:nuclease-related domain-containing protein [Bacillus sp. FJAT-29790]MBU8878123.1 NERD domain-containing protein [Bacillus sp. FJAT-29790]
MIIKPRIEPEELKIMRCLHRRMNLSVKDRNNYFNLEKGFEGERNFDEWLKNLSNDWIILNDLLFESNNTLFQIDTLLISPETIYMFEVKNYEGDYYIDDDRWFTISGSEIKNPLLQLKRSESLLRRLLNDLGITTPIESNLVFVNPDFYLYQTPLNIPIIFPPQILRFIKKLNLNSSKIRDNHLNFAEKIVSIHIKESPYTRRYDYSYENLKKGITCATCYSIIDDINVDILTCNKCGSKEDVTSAVLRSTEEFILLFLNEKITTKTIHEWCKVIKSKKTIRRILSKKYNKNGNCRYLYFVNAAISSD